MTQFHFPTDLVRSGEDQRRWFARFHARESVQQNVATFFRVESTEEKKISRILESRKARQKFGFGILRNLRCFNAERRNFFARLVKPERFPGESAFFFRGEDDSCGVAQDAIFRPRPVE